MLIIRGPGRSFIPFAILILAAASPAWPEETAAPYGVAGSASSARNCAEWMPKMTAAGVSTVRLFPEWRGVEPTQGTWTWEPADALLKAAAENKIEVNAILMGSVPWSKSKAHAFPMSHLDDWSTYVSAAVGHCKGRVRYWEVWNEGNGGFNDEHHTAVDYAKLAAATYAAAKKADPEARVGLSVASFDPGYLDQAIRAMAQQGTPGSFDFLAIHPYEIADGLTDPDGEIPYLWMTHLLRDMLRRSAPERRDAEVWITEIGRQLGDHGGRVTTEADAAKALVKLYTMALAQGVRRTEWFEAQDPAGEDQGFGLLDRSGRPRAAYHALKTMTAQLGPSPRYLGWLAPGVGQRSYGFVFQGALSPVLVAWMPAGGIDKSLTLTREATIVDSLSGVASKVKAGTPLVLSDTPVFVVGVPADLLATAKANADKSFPWGGDYSKADSVSTTLGKRDTSEGDNTGDTASAGVFQVGRQSTPHCTFPDGSTGIILRGDQSAQFFVHPSFAGFDARDYYVRVGVRRLAPGNLGMNLFYEVADSQGRAPYHNKGEWYAVPKEDGWHAHTWHVTDACFAKMWGYDVSIRPEQSVPFVLGKVEVSKTPFKEDGATP